MNTNEQVSNATPIVVVKNVPATVTARVITMPMPNDLTEEMFRIYNLSKTTRVLAMIDIFFALIYSLYNFYFFIAFCVAFSGYYGAKKYDSCSLLVYGSYLFLNNLIRIITIGFMIQYYSNHEDQDTNNVSFSIVFATIICLLNLYIAKFVCVFWNKVKQLSQEDRVNLILMEQQNRVAPNYIWRV
tara:strand:- start:2403 stop:2960 length:558 start_codon:yes stop_codon:yes gene_type:complete